MEELPRLGKHLDGRNLRSARDAVYKPGNRLLQGDASSRRSRQTFPEDQGATLRGEREWGGEKRGRPLWTWVQFSPTYLPITKLEEEGSGEVGGERVATPKRRNPMKH